MKKVEILGVTINSITSDHLQAAIEKFLDSKGPNLICTPNTEFIVTAQEDAYFKEILNNTSKLNLPDGFGLLWAAKFNTLPVPNVKVIREIVIFFEWIFSLIIIPITPNFFKNPIRDRITGADFTKDIARIAAEKNSRIFLLGGAPTVAERTALQLQTEIPNLKIGGVNSGKKEMVSEIIGAINKSRSEILLVAFGSPKQEKWLAENLLKTKCKIGVGVGGSFDFIAGIKKRAPKWVQKSGLEWLFRLIQEPGRIKRQMALPKFMWLVLENRLRNIKTPS